MEQHWGQNRLDKSDFIRRLHALTDKLHALFTPVGAWLKQQRTVVATSDGVPVELHIHPGGESEQDGRRSLPLDLPAGSLLYPKAGYTGVFRLRGFRQLPIYKYPVHCHRLIHAPKSSVTEPVT